MTARPLKPADVSAAAELVEAVGIHGVYVRNVLHAHPRLGAQANLLAFERDAELQGLAYFGPRGNLLVLERRSGSLDPATTAEAILDSRASWRIVLAPDDVSGELVRRGRLVTLVDRRQIYYGVRGDALQVPVPEGGKPAVRLAEKKDLDALMEAALDLNQSDLRVDPWCVDRDWLRRSTKLRIRRRTTFVIGAPGAPLAKLDLGSSGPAGVVIEGVYTWPDRRGKGLAAALVASVAAAQLVDHPLVCLHVAADNVAARRAYEKCGMTVAGACRLMLRG